MVIVAFLGLILPNSYFSVYSATYQKKGESQQQKHELCQIRIHNWRKTRGLNTEALAMQMRYIGEDRQVDQAEHALRIYYYLSSDQPVAPALRNRL
jgi:hypothetical protein